MQTSTPPAAALLPPRPRIKFPDSFRRLERKADSPSTKMLLAMAALGKPMYEGTVPAATKAKRRARNKAAGLSRRINRKARR